ncbi:MAG: transposase [Acidobacteriia bacterium]|nr:transposase [Terriglobia bacterium]
MPKPIAHRLRPKDSCALFCFRCFTPFAVSRSSWNSLDYDLLFRWFVGLSLDEKVWDVTVFGKNRDGLLDGDIASAFFERVLCHAREQRLLSDEHFTVDGTPIEPWAGQKSFKKKGNNTVDATDDSVNPTVDFKGEKRSNKTHPSTADPDARLYKKAKGQESKLCWQGHVVMQNRNGLVVNARVTKAMGTAVRPAAVDMPGELPGKRRVTSGATRFTIRRNL